MLAMRPVFALDASEFPQQLANQLNVPLFAGQLICSTIVLLMVLLPLNAVIGKGDRKLPNLIVGLPTIGVLIAMGWFPVFLLLIICLLVALMYGKKMGEILGGH